MVMKNNVFRKIMELLPILLIIGLFAALVYSIYYSSMLEEQIWERDKTIQELSFRSELVDEYFDYGTVPDDSSKMYYTLKESKIPRRVVKEKEYEYVDRITVKTIDRTPYINSGDSTASLSVLIEKYNTLQKKYNNLVDTVNRNNTEITKQNMVLGMIEKNYGITYSAIVDSNIIKATLTNTEKVDSALILLPYYRDRLELKEDGTWLIKLRKTWFGL